MSTVTIQPLREAVQGLNLAVAELRKAFGAPGDYGYETKQGKTLFALLQANTAAARALHWGGEKVLPALAITQLQPYAPDTFADEGYNLRCVAPDGSPLLGGYFHRYGEDRRRWTAVRRRIDQDGARWQHHFIAVTDDFGNLVEVAR